MLVITYTNHALDQFLEAILDSGFPASGMLRVGGRTTSERVEQLSLFRALDAMRKPGAAQAPMDAATKAHNFTLGRQIDSARERAKALVRELHETSWDRPKQVPLIRLEDYIDVRSSLAV